MSLHEWGFSLMLMKNLNQMSKEATQLLEWEGTDGSQRSLLLVTDKSKHKKSLDYKKIELCKMNDDSWKTIETIDTVDTVVSFGIPEEFIDSV